MGIPERKGAAAADSEPTTKKVMTEQEFMASQREPPKVGRLSARLPAGGPPASRLLARLLAACCPACWPPVGPPVRPSWRHVILKGVQACGTLEKELCMLLL